MQSLMNRDDSFRFLKTLRGSLPYFERARKELFAMIRQLGQHHYFAVFHQQKQNGVIYKKFLGNLLIARIIVMKNWTMLLGRKGVDSFKVTQNRCTTFWLSILYFLKRCINEENLLRWAWWKIGFIESNTNSGVTLYSYVDMAWKCTSVWCW